ncbi:Phosphopantetheine attachment site [Eubacterium pyruvativorans]|uniref:Phosphopantetheine attachment site n=1 Tax=Eubacterium pyruvativorans TaxID=155865 RepID=A0A1I7FYJ0_9FIRM|nr:acyl carrier protein [Eubacterium pyruvativorans]MDO5567752.1 acyl carrier protein [Eubacteriales bacterium]HAT82719.1 acyl carrier protein [Eubacterium sp.]MCI5747277.1 acyl carrier protein [Eubacterium pyruvativorans]MDD6708160.1 acyl carrier protein [Eubacterium pyruvativorans]MDD7685061.1 acyl carrier protein [Eubacterium pyruvativorans]
MEKQSIIDILTDVKDGIDYENEKNLIDDELLDSFDVVAIVGELDETFDIEITMDDMIPENFNSVDAICALVQKLQEA